MNINVVDEIMGRGKSSAAINYINNLDPDKRVIVITPYLDEIQRYKESCPQMKFSEPAYKGGSKLSNIKYLIKKGRNIVSTHALFNRFDTEIISLCSKLDYILIMDEVASVVTEYSITQCDLETLLNKYCNYNEETGVLTWRTEEQRYTGKFEDIKNLCNLGAVVLARGKILLWLFPIEVFNSFSEIYILTYMFKAQIQAYYYDYYNLPYTFKYIAGDSTETYRFSDTPEPCVEDYSNLIHIVDNEKLNKIGSERTDLSRGWFDKNEDTALIEKLQGDIYNFFHNIRKSPSKENLWTTFKKYKSRLSGNGYSRGFLSLNARATNAYRERSSLAYAVNIYLNPMVKGFFQDHNVKIDEDGYALSEMLQWIWRSAIRDGKEIWIYVPSVRMRNLLINWIFNVSKN